MTLLIFKRLLRRKKKCWYVKLSQHKILKDESLNAMYFLGAASIFGSQFFSSQL